MIDEDCTIDCERMPECTLCHKRKKPSGRDASLVAANSFCDSDCPEYYEHPTPGHLWPGELKRAAEQEGGAGVSEQEMDIMFLSPQTLSPEQLHTFASFWKEQGRKAGHKDGREAMRAEVLRELESLGRQAYGGMLDSRIKDAIARIEAIK